MQKIKLTFFCLILFAFNSCKSKTDLSESSWKSSSSDSLLKYIIEEKGNGQPARRENIAIVSRGWLDAGKLVNDTAEGGDFVVRPMIINNIISEKIPIGSKGLVSINMKDLILRMYSNSRHYAIYFHSDTKFSDLKSDSLQLAASGMFKQIKLISAGDAADQFDKDNPDVEWKKILDNNPLPSSIDLVLKEELLVQSKYDSIKAALVQQFPMATISGLPDRLFDIGKGAVVVYKFVILE